MEQLKELKLCRALSHFPVYLWSSKGDHLCTCTVVWFFITVTCTNNWHLQTFHASLDNANPPRIWLLAWNFLCSKGGTHTELSLCSVTYLVHWIFACTNKINDASLHAHTDIWVPQLFPFVLAWDLEKHPAFLDFSTFRNTSTLLRD